MGIKKWWECWLLARLLAHCLLAQLSSARQRLPRQGQWGQAEVGAEWRQGQERGQGAEAGAHLALLVTLPPAHAGGLDPALLLRAAAIRELL